MRFGLKIGFIGRGGPAPLFPHDGRNYVYVPPGGDSNVVLLSTQLTTSTTWTTAVAGRARIAKPNESAASRFMVVGSQAFLDYSPGAGWVVFYRTAGNGYGATAAAASPVASAATQDIGFMLTQTNVTLYARESTADLDDQDWDVWTGWTSFGSVSVTAAAANDLSASYIGSGFTTLHTSVPIYGALIGIDDQTALLDPQTQTESGGALGPWTLLKATTGEQTRVVTAPVYV